MSELPLLWVHVSFSGQHGSAIRGADDRSLLDLSALQSEISYRVCDSIDILETMITK